MTQETDMQFLMERPEFRRFLSRSIQMAGLLEYSASAANGTDGRNLHFAEGRRSLGFDILRDADLGQPEALRHPNSIMTLIAALREEANTPQRSEKSRGSRYDEVESP